MGCLEGSLVHIENGVSAPEFFLKALDGKQYSLASLLEQGPVVLAFFKISCPVCQFTFPFLQRIFASTASKRASIVGVSQDDARSTKEFNEEYGVSFLTLVDSPGYPVSNAYGLTNVPTVFMIAPDGKVKVNFTGFDKAALEQIAAELSEHGEASAAPLFLPDEVVPAYKPG